MSLHCDVYWSPADCGCVDVCESVEECAGRDEGGGETGEGVMIISTGKVTNPNFKTGKTISTCNMKSGIPSRCGAPLIKEAHSHLPPSSLTAHSPVHIHSLIIQWSIKLN